MYNDSVENCGHRHNILEPSLSLVGIGWIAGSAYGSVSAQEFMNSASWNPYHASSPQHTAVHIAIHAPAVGNRQHLSDPYIHCQAVTDTSSARPAPRITWFLDRIGNQRQNGSLWSLDRRHLSPGRHILFAYAVDSEQNYSVATYSFVV